MPFNFEEAAEIWYQRTKKLCRYWQSQENPYKKRHKAFQLYLIMFARVRQCMNVYLLLSQPKKNIIFDKGGQASGKAFASDNLNGSEYVITKADSFKRTFKGAGLPSLTLEEIFELTKIKKSNQ